MLRYSDLLKIKHFKILSFIIFMIIMTIPFMALERYWAHINLKNREFSGIVTELEYSTQGFPVLIIDNKKYSVYNYGSEINIQKGDSVVKKKGICDLYVYKTINNNYKILILKSYQ